MSVLGTATDVLRAVRHQASDLVARYIDARQALAQERARNALLEDAYSRQLALNGQLLRGLQEVSE